MRQRLTFEAAAASRCACAQRTRQQPHPNRAGAGGAAAVTWRQARRGALRACAGRMLAPPLAPPAPGLYGENMAPFPEEVDVFSAPHWRMKQLVGLYCDKVESGRVGNGGGL